MTHGPGPLRSFLSRLRSYMRALRPKGTHANYSHLGTTSIQKETLMAGNRTTHIHPNGSRVRTGCFYFFIVATPHTSLSAGCFHINMRPSELLSDATATMCTWLPLPAKHAEEASCTRPLRPATPAPMQGCSSGPSPLHLAGRAPVSICSLFHITFRLAGVCVLVTSEGEMLSYCACFAGHLDSS